MKERTIQFEATASRPKQGLVVIYDLEGFSQFFNQPDVQDYVPKYLNRVNDAIGRIIYGGVQYWLPPTHKPSRKWPALTALPAHEKFLGDGAMFIWLDQAESTISTPFVVDLCNHLWNLKTNFEGVVKAAYDEMPVFDLPKRIRIGIARGTIFELSRCSTRQKEYIGFCINLASRLQKYCPELGFIASARIGLPQATLDENRWIRVVAKDIKGFPREIVIVDSDEYKSLKSEIRSRYFENIESAA